MAIKLRLKSKRDPALPPSQYNNIVLEAMSVTRKLDALRRFPASKLTAEAFLAESLTADENASLKGVRKLRDKLEQKPLPPAFLHSARTLARMVAGLKESTWRSPPTKYPWRLQTAFSTPETTGELIACRSSTIELYGVAIQIVGERNPDVWGTCDSTAKHAAQVADLEARQAELFQKLDTALTGEDLNIDPVDRTAAVSFKIAPAVPLAPRNDAGARLVAYLMQKRAQQNGQGV